MFKRKKISTAEFTRRYSTEEACREHLAEQRWPDGFWAVSSVHEDRSALIDQLVQMRKNPGLTQKQLAAACGFIQSVVARFESKRTTPTVATFCRIASSLGACVSVTKAS